MMGYAELEVFHENDQNEDLNNLEPEMWELDLELEPLAEPTELDRGLEPFAVLEEPVDGMMGFADLEAFHEADQAEDGQAVLTPEDLNNLYGEIWELDQQLEPLAESTVLDLLLEPLADVGVEQEMNYTDLEAFHEAYQAEDGWAVLTPEDLNLQQEIEEFELELDLLAELTVLDLLLEPFAELEGPADGMIGYTELEAFHEAD